MRVAIVGAEGSVGSELLTGLAESGLEAGVIEALTLSKAANSLDVSFGEEAIIPLRSVQELNFEGLALAVFAPHSGGKEEKERRLKLIKAARAGNIRVLDLSPDFRFDPDVPLLGDPGNSLPPSPKGFYAMPDPLALLAVLALTPFARGPGLKRAHVTALVPMAYSGRAAMDELFAQTRGIFVNDPPKPEAFSKSIAFNALPYVGRETREKRCEAEWRIIGELKRLLGAKLRIESQAVYVPLFTGLGMSCNLELLGELSIKKARTLIKASEGLALVDYDHEEGFVTPGEAAGETGLYVSRLREDISLANGLSFWLACDLLRVAYGYVTTRWILRLLETIPSEAA